MAACCTPNAGPQSATDAASMHAYAGHDAQALARVLKGAPRSRKAPPDVELPDAWGNTLLHTACATRGAQRQVVMLLAAGADPQATGPYGMTPGAAALMARHFKAAQVVSAAGGTTDLRPFNEASERSLLANVFGIDGVTWLHGRALELEGAFEFGAYPRLADAVEAFARTGADTRLWSAKMWAEVVRALREAPANHYLPSKAVRAKARSGTPTMLATGWRGHSVCVAFAGRDAVRADRRREHPWSGYKAVQPWRFHAGGPRRRDIARLRNNRSRSPLPGKMVLAWMDAVHRPQRKDIAAQACDNVAPRTQQANNCTVANAKAAVFGLLTLLRARHPAAGKVDGPAVRARLHTEYKRLTTFVRLWFLESYRARHTGVALSAHHPADWHLVSRCEAKLRACAGRRPWTAELRELCKRELQHC